MRQRLSEREMGLLINHLGYSVEVDLVETSSTGTGGDPKRIFKEGILYGLLLDGIVLFEGDGGYPRTAANGSGAVSFAGTGKSFYPYQGIAGPYLNR